MNVSPYLLSIISAILLFFSFPPFHIWPLAWVAFVPYLIGVGKERRENKAIIASWIFNIWLIPFFLCFAGVTHTWHIGGNVIYPFIIVVIYLVLSIYAFVLVSIWRLRYLPAGLHIFSFSVFWCLFEFAFKNIPLINDFPLVQHLAFSQLKNIPILQLATITGTYGVSFLILFFNCSIAYLLLNWNSKTAKRLLVAVALITLTIWIYGYSVLPKPGKEINITIIQEGNPGCYKNPFSMLLGGNKPKWAPLEFYDKLTREHVKYNTDIIMWSMVWITPGDHSKEGSWLRKKLVNLSREYNSILCISPRNYAPDRIINLLIQPDGRIGEYDMHHPPLFNVLRLFPFLKIPNYPSPEVGLSYPRYPVFDTKFGILGMEHCFDTQFPYITRKLVKKEAKLILYISDNTELGVFYKYFEPSNIILRAVENRVGFASVSGNGISLLVDPYGRVITSSGLYAQEVLNENLPLTGKGTFYTHYGDIFGYIIVLLSLLLIFYNFYLKRRGSFIYCMHCGNKVPKGDKICPDCGKNPKVHIIIRLLKT